MARQNYQYEKRQKELAKKRKKEEKKKKKEAEKLAETMGAEAGEKTEVVEGAESTEAPLEVNVSS